ncbi:MAG: hypothetical protein U9O78_02180 [Patescibacteria group bacterium]|nr:hypothetical protein [Patescibacteria group bacterium]
MTEKKSSNSKKEKNSTKKQNLTAALTYLAGWITGLVFFAH